MDVQKATINHVNTSWEFIWAELSMSKSQYQGQSIVKDAYIFYGALPYVVVSYYVHFPKTGINTSWKFTQNNLFKVKGQASSKMI